MHKLKVYLDTSVISYLKQDDAPEKMNDTLLLWNDIKSGKYQIHVSDITLAEIAKCPEPKRAFMRECLAQIEFTDISKDEETELLSKLYFDIGGLPPKSKDDAQHIAVATVYQCDIILSWNFKHIVNLRAITAVESVNIKQGYRMLRIMSPTMLLDYEED